LGLLLSSVGNSGIIVVNYAQRCSISVVVVLVFVSLAVVAFAMASPLGYTCLRDVILISGVPSDVATLSSDDEIASDVATLDSDDVIDITIDPVDFEEPVWCPICEMWLNGPTQYKDHEIGFKHKKNSRRIRRRNARLFRRVAAATNTAAVAAASTTTAGAAAS
jgi:hypothetical protein